MDRPSKAGSYLLGLLFFIVFGLAPAESALSKRTIDWWLAKLGATDTTVTVLSVQDSEVNGSFGMECFGGMVNTEAESEPRNVEILCHPDILIQFPDWPEEIGELILLHELGHRDSFMRGNLDWTYALDPKPEEFAADVFAAQTWCQAGRDPKWIVEKWRRIRATGYIGNESHGTPAERVRNILAKADSCRWDGIETQIGPLLLVGNGN